MIIGVMTLYDSTTMKKNYILLLFTAVMLLGCSNDAMYLKYALRSAGENRAELEKVLDHYKNDKLKLAAAKYLIANMPAHYSYADTCAANSYYDIALKVMADTTMTPEKQRDSLRTVSDLQFSAQLSKTVPDNLVITADYLIYNIDHAFEQWRTRPWAKHLSYAEFRDWLLPYKNVDLQSFDAWRDTLSANFCDSISRVPADDYKRLSVYGAIDIVRNEIHTLRTPRVLWGERSGFKMLSAATLNRMTFGSCYDYVNMGVLTFRSLGIPAVIDQVPVWGRNSDGHSWFTFPSDRGIETPTMNSLIMGAGMGFYPYERIPKVFRTTYAINRDRVKYLNTAKYKHKFDVCVEDVTYKYNRTSDLQINVHKDIKLKDKYVYIAMYVNGNGPQTHILDFGVMRHGKACFSKIGRNMLYVALGYDGNGLVKISDPFILRKDGSVDYLCASIGPVISADIRRKYYQNNNVVYMRSRLRGAQIQASDRADFKDCDTLFTIENIYIPDKLPIDTAKAYRYWRYMSPDDSYGSIAEISFFDDAGNLLDGKHIACAKATHDEMERAFDGNLLSNFEADSTSGIWVGMDFGHRTKVSGIRVIPRSDDNDVCVGNEYELLCFDARRWVSLGYRKADSNVLHYDNVPRGALLWLRNYTRGHDERPFIIKDDGTIEWW